MPAGSTFRNLDPPHAQLGAAPAEHAGDPGDPAAPRRSRGVGDGLSALSDAVPRVDTRSCSTRGRDRTVGAPRTHCHSGRTAVIGSPVDLNEVEELDTIAIWPHPHRPYVVRCVRRTRAAPREARSANSGPFAFLGLTSSTRLDRDWSSRHFCYRDRRRGLAPGWRTRLPTRRPGALPARPPRTSASRARVPVTSVEVGPGPGGGDRSSRPEPGCSRAGCILPVPPRWCASRTARC
jgi:hypothetical protein